MGLGTQEFADFLPHSIKEYSDLRGGIGLENEEVDVPTDTTEESMRKRNRLWWSESIETTKNRYITLGPLVVSAGDLATPPLKIIDFAGVTYVFGTSVSKYWDGAALQAADASPLANLTDAIVFTDATNDYLIVCNGSDVRYCSIGYGASKDWATLSTNDAKYLASFDKRLFGINSTGTVVYYSARDNCDNAAGGAMSYFNISGPWTTATDLFCGKGFQTGEEILYMVTDTGLVTIDYWTRVAYPALPIPKTANALVGAWWNALVLMATGSGITTINTGLEASQFGADIDDGLPADEIGYVYDILPLCHWILIAVSGGTKSSILKRHESTGGWHQIYTSSSNIRTLWHSTLTSPGYLWFGEGNYVKYLMLPDKTHDVTKVSGYTYAASGEFILPRLSRLSVLPKIALSVDALTEDCNATETITVYLRVNETTSWGTAVGTFVTSGHPTEISLGSGLGTAFNDIQMKVALARGTTTTNSPKLKSIALKFIPSPAPVLSWTFKISAAGDRAKEIITNLETARDASTLVNFSPVGDLGISTKYVKVESIPSVQELDKYAVEKQLEITLTEAI